MKIKIYDMVVIEDSKGVTYHDCVVKTLARASKSCVIFCNSIYFTLYRNKILKFSKPETGQCQLLEVWRKQDKDFYKCIYKKSQKEIDVEDDYEDDAVQSKTEK